MTSEHSTFSSRLVRTAILRSCLQALRILVIVSAAWVLARPGIKTARAAGPEVIRVAGTTTVDGSGGAWAYLVWETPGSSTPGSFPVAVYSKAGKPGDPGHFVRHSVALPVTDPGAVALLLGRGSLLGENVPRLEESLELFFGGLKLPPDLSLPDRLASIVRQSQSDPQAWRILRALVSKHPLLGLCAGLAHVERIPLGRETTFELRRFDTRTATDDTVVGRLTLDPDRVASLPAPSRPVQVPTYEDADQRTFLAEGHRNIRLRWVVPPDLARLGLLHSGYVAYRLTAEFAAARQLDRDRPGEVSVSNLEALVSEFPESVVRIDSVPTAFTKSFDEITVANFAAPPTGDPVTFHLADDNSGAPGGTPPFQNGSSFVYYLVPRDTLGRLGSPSLPGSATACDRIPADPPKVLKVGNHYDPAQGLSPQRLQVAWETDGASPIPAGATRRYRIFRWSTSGGNLQDPGGRGYSATGHLAEPKHAQAVGEVSHVPGGTSFEWIDSTGPGSPGFSPPIPASEDLTYWYTIQIVDTSICGVLVSPHSPPAFGVLRDREGPPPPTGTLTVDCVEPRIGCGTVERVDNPNGIDGIEVFRFVLEEPPRELAGVRFLAGNANDTEFRELGTYSLSERPITPSVQHTRRATSVHSLFVRCEVWDASGLITSAVCEIPPDSNPTSNKLRLLAFRATMVSTRTPLSWAPASLGCPHVSQGCGPEIQVNFPGTDAREYRIYKSTDGGALHQMVSDLVPATASFVTHCDPVVSPNGSENCYFVQTYDAHGNGSPLVHLGCAAVRGSSPPPVPTLFPIVAEGDTSNPEMSLRWTCPPAGVDRFQIRLNRAPRREETTWTATLFGGQPAPAIVQSVPPGNTESDETQIEFKHSVSTGKVGVGQEIGPGPDFQLLVPVKLGFKYWIKVRPIMRTGQESEAWSQARSFAWRPPPPPSPDGRKLAWPARAPVEVRPNTEFDPPVHAVRLDPTVYNPFVSPVPNGNDGMELYPVGIRIADLGLDRDIRGGHDPLSVVSRETSLARRSVLPGVLYRIQEPNANFPAVSGTLVQVSPLIEDIAYTKSGLVSTVVDPFVGVVGVTRRGDTFYNPRRYDMYLLDTTPVLRGAQYRYYLARFDQRRELTDVVDAGSVTIED